MPYLTRHVPYTETPNYAAMSDADLHAETEQLSGDFSEAWSRLFRAAQEEIGRCGQLLLPTAGYLWLDYDSYDSWSLEAYGEHTDGCAEFCDHDTHPCGQDVPDELRELALGYASRLGLVGGMWFIVGGRCFK